MSKAREVFNACCSCICAFGIAFYLWSYISQPGIYGGHLSGHILIYPPDDSDEYFIHDIHFNAKTELVWKWKEPENFAYDGINLSINENMNVTVFFPSLTYTHFFPSLTCTNKDGEGKFSKSYLSDLLTTSSETGSATMLPEQLDELYSFILSAGNGTLPRPRHHMYSFDSPYRVSFTHFMVGGGPQLGLVGISVFAAGIVLRLFGTLGEGNTDALGKLHRQHRRFTLVSAAVLANFGVFFLGVYLDNSYGGAVNTFGEFLCVMTSFLGILLLPCSIVYSLVRHLNPKIEEWDFFGVSLAVLFFLIVTLAISSYLGYFD